MNHPNKCQCRLSSLQNLNVIYERFFKKYRHIRSDVQPVIDQLQAGEVMGDQVPGTHYTLYSRCNVWDWGSQMLISKVGLSYDREAFIG